VSSLRILKRTVTKQAYTVSRTKLEILDPADKKERDKKDPPDAWRRTSANDRNG